MKKKCTFCSSEIPIDANYCTECEKFQDWRRYFSFSNMLLTLLIALISVASTGIPFLMSTIKVDRSNIEVHYLNCHPEDFQLILSNTGNKEAVFRTGKLDLRQLGNIESGKKHPINIELLNGKSNFPIIKAGETGVFRVKYTNNERDLPYPDQNDRPCYYTVRLTIIAYNNGVEEPAVTCDCKKDI